MKSVVYMRDKDRRFVVKTAGNRIYLHAGRPWHCGLSFVKWNAATCAFLDATIIVIAPSDMQK